MLVKSSRRYINTLDKILKNQHNDIITKITEYKDYYISYIKLNFYIEGRYCFVATHNDTDTVVYYVEGSNDMIEYIISDRETQKESMYKIINKIYDLVVTLSTETAETSEADYNEYEEILDSKESTEHDRINYLMETHSTPTINFEYRNLMYTDEYKAAHNEMSLPCRVCTHFCTRFDTENYRMEYCCRKNKENEKKAIKNFEWHHVNLNTLTNLDFDMLDEKRQLYLKLYRELKELIQDLHKCKSGRAYERRLAKMYIRNAELFDENKISQDYINYFTRKISMCNVECGLWTSRVEEATGLHKSRRYNRYILKY
jgi:hypothetical protein